MSLLTRTSAVAIAGRAVLIAGESSSGKSSLALALIDRGAVLIGDDGVTLELRAGQLFISPPPRIAGLIEVRNLGLIEMPTVADVPAALMIQLDPGAERFIDAAEQVELAGASLPLIRLWGDSPIAALKAELALDRWGLA